MIHAVIQTDHRYHERMVRNKAEKMLFPFVDVTSSDTSNDALVASSASSRRASDATVTADHPGTDQAQDAHMAVEELEEESSSRRPSKSSSGRQHDSVADNVVTSLKPGRSRRRSSISYRAEN